jgi:hypothetical protein
MTFHDPGALNLGMWPVQVASGEEKLGEKSVTHHHHSPL